MCFYFTQLKNPKEGTGLLFLANNVSFIPIFFLVTFGNKVAKIWKYYVIFVYILQGKMGMTEKRRNKNHVLGAIHKGRLLKGVGRWVHQKEIY
jgi:hypothetical protein